MSNSLYTGVTGLSTAQQMLDVVGNNLANANTTGFKDQQIEFSDLFYQTVRAGTNSATAGGTDPIQIGSGVQVGAVNSIMDQGTINATGRDLDLAMQGSGFFVANDGTQNLYTRAGSFGIDANNYLVDPATGYRIQRFGAVGEGSSTTPSFQVPGNDDIQIPLGTTVPGQLTTNVTLQGNLSAGATGPQASVLTSAAAFTTGSPAVPATASTLLNSLSDNQVHYVAGDQLHLVGTDANNATVNATVPVSATTTLGDLVNAINADYTGATASIDSTGNLVLTAKNAGPNNLSIAISDVSTNTGGTTWGAHALAVTTAGKMGDTAQTGIDVYDAQGSPHTVTFTFQKQTDGTWNMTTSLNPSEGTLTDNSVTGLTFNDDGSFRGVTGTGLGDPYITVRFNGQSSTQTIGFNFGSPGKFNGLTQDGGTSSAVASAQDGFAAGQLSNISIGADGTINGNFSNGRTLAVAQLAVAKFANEAALDRTGSNYYQFSSQSGLPQLGTATSGSRGSVQQKALEASNVNVSAEFTRLIVAQQAFSVNARTITVSDQVLQELTNIIH